MKLLGKESLVLALATSAFIVAACSEAQDDDDGTGGTATTTTGSAQGGAATNGTNTTNGTTTTTGTGGAGGMVPDDYQGVVINEVSVDGIDWIELYNTSSNDVTFENGIRLTDFDDTTMGPRVGAEFDGTDLSGLTITAGGYLVALNEEPGTLECTDVAATAPCYPFGKGLSRTDGDTVYLVDGSDNVLLRLEIVGDTIADGTMDTYGRFPNGTGSFAVLSGPGTLGEPNNQ